LRDHPFLNVLMEIGTANVTACRSLGGKVLSHRCISAAARVPRASSLDCLPRTKSWRWRRLLKWVGRRDKDRIAQHFSCPGHAPGQFFAADRQGRCGDEKITMRIRS
jgi:hypothetical protein